MTTNIIVDRREGYNCDPMKFSMLLIAIIGVTKGKDNYTIAEVLPEDVDITMQQIETHLITPQFDEIIFKEITR